jgi:hypothetical protein
MFHKCRSWDHIKDKNIDFRNENYFPIVGDPCYRYCREVKEVFFRNWAASYLFLKALPTCQNDLINKYKEKRGVFTEVIRDLEVAAKRELNKQAPNAYRLLY